MRKVNEIDLVSLLLEPDPASVSADLTARHVKHRSGERVIGIDGRVFYFGPSMERGIGHYTLSHLKEIFAQRPSWRFVFFVDEYLPMAPLSSLLELPNTSVSTYDDPVPEDLSLFHIPDSLSMMPAFDSPFRVAPKVPLSVLFLDLIPLVMREYHIDTWAPQTQMAYRSRLRQMRDTGALVLSISENSKADLVRHAGVSPDRIVTVMGGLNRAERDGPPDSALVEATLRKYGLEKPFFMSVGALDHHKNFPATANAFVTAKQQTPLQLAVVGGNSDPYKGMYREALAKQGIGDVVFTGYVSREELICLYSRSCGLIFPSLYEGFGLPVLEAMAAGCPVITSNVSSLPEVAGDAAILVAPDDVASIARGMLSLASDRAFRERLIERGLRQATRFTWAETARRTILAWESEMQRGVCAKI